MALEPGVFLLSIGDELLDGRTQNTNASWIGEQLRLSGVPVAEVRCVSDRIEDIVAALRYGRRFGLTITTGGLGPTNDDRTLAGAAKAFARPLREHSKALAHLRARYKARGLPLTEARRRMALAPEGAIVLENQHGTAPGSLVREGSSRFVFLPGPPSECRPMFTNKALPLALKLRSQKLVRREFWRTFGKGESDVYDLVAARVKEWEAQFPGTFRFGVHISFPCVDLTLEIWQSGRAKRPSAKQVDGFTAEISAALGSLCFTRARENLVDVVCRELAQRKLTLSTAESCTGGLLGKMITDLPGSSSYYMGGVVSYANEAKQELLGVRAKTLAEHGAVSAPAVQEMADGIRRRLRTDFSLALSGVAGPGGGSAEKPVGTIYVGLSGAAGSKSLHQLILGGRGSRDQNRTIAVHLALDALRAEILVSTLP